MWPAFFPLYGPHHKTRPWQVNAPDNPPRTALLLPNGPHSEQFIFCNPGTLPGGATLTGATAGAGA
ncbi:hypothetical protein CFY86_02085 [Raoultella ornithinolytica]|uniref:Uncharacterized protein n=1 Tax=Raoultella ornithinolytica TaxID=54291 RepID=A0A855FCC1_RAOOR|nr:hypothetical protein CFY86_02085 [Raoultella ornithinolytica]RWU00975.1 hypothetical protein DN602_07390 [Raoultella ornithinolytica]